LDEPAGLAGGGDPGRDLPVGHWRNDSDARYFGAVQLAALPGENVLAGHYTGYASDIEVSRGRWTWVRLDPASLAGVDLGRVTLRDPQDLAELLDGSYWQTKVVGGQANITCDLLNLYLDDGTAIAEWQAEFDDTAQQVRKRMREVALLTLQRVPD
jgi:hypothetical protein